MKKISICVLVAAVMVAAGLSTSSCDSVKKAKLSNDIDSVSYAVGLNQGAGIHGQLPTIPGGPLNVDDMIAGFIAGIKGDSSKRQMTVEEAQAYMQQWFPQAQTREAEKTKAEGEKFLEENKTKNGVITTESGLQYEIISPSEGPRPGPAALVRVNYEGSLLDGTVFDSSYDVGEPAEFYLDRVIPGWSEGLQLMTVGSAYRLYIPSELAYGEQGAGMDIPPSALLIFDVELMEILDSPVVDPALERPSPPPLP